MKKNKILFVLLLLISISVVCTCGTFFYVKVNNSKQASGQFVIMTSCNPVYLATINIVGDAEGVTVENLSQPTTGCLHDYTLTTQDMKNLSRADVLVVNGGGMEGYLDDVVAAYPDLTIIDTFEYVEEKGLLPEEILEESEEEHEHEDAHVGEEHEYEDEEIHEEEHHHDHGANSHIWMSPALHQAQAEAIAEGLSELDSRNSAVYLENAKVYEESIENGIDKDVLESEFSGSNVAILHEAFAYTAYDLGANVVATMDLDEERQVSAGEVSELLDEIKEHDVKIVLAEYDYGKAMGDLIEEQTDAKVVYLETLVHGTYTADSYVNTINDNFAKIRSSL